MKFPRLFGRRAAAVEQKDSATGRILVMNPGQPAWSGRDYASFAREAYQRNYVAYMAISKIADAMSSVRWTAWRGETELAKHPALDLIANPNPMQSAGQYMRAKVGFFLIAGNGFEEVVRVGGEAREMYQWRPDRTKVIPSANGFPEAYRYEAGGRMVTMPVDVRGGQMISDVRHLKFFNPLDDWYGQSPLEAAAYAIDQNNEAMTWMQSLLQNSARPSGALVMAPDSTLTDDQFVRLKAQVEENYSGAKNAGRPMLLEGGLDWKAMGFSPADMAIMETKFSSARDIAAALGVPPQLLGIPGDNTYSNYQEARLSFWEDTVIPLAEMIGADWSEWLGAGEIMIKPEFDHIPAIVAKKSALWDMANAATFLTDNEKRAMVGYEPVDGGDELRPTVSQDTLRNVAYGNQGE